MTGSRNRIPNQLKPFDQIGSLICGEGPLPPMVSVTADGHRSKPFVSAPVTDSNSVTAARAG